MTERDTPATARSDLDAWRASIWPERFDRDVFLCSLLRRYLGPRWEEVESRLRTIAEETGAALAEPVLESGRDENLPTLRQRDADGRSVEEVVFHPAYHEVGRAFWASGVLAALGDPGSDVLAGAIAYLLGQHGEAGHACPVACTSGAIKLIQRVGTPDQRTRYLPSLLETDYDRRCHAAQFVTEVQGGSDVGLNACRAEPEAGRPGWFRITGEKWFCSVADAELFVVCARPAGAPDGTKGLGLFLVPRTVDGRPNGLALRRLKYKLGTRSMATAEIDFDNALGESIGALEDGFRNLVGTVLDTSRVHNALIACAFMRRAAVEAHDFARNRRAFSRPIIEFPAVRETLARMRLRTAAGLATTFRILDMSDRLDGGADDGLAAARRIAVMINKYWTAVACTQVVRDGIEILGGNGTIEDFSVLPRLYRDAIVIESWEGTHNTLCAQVLRDFADRGLHRMWLDALRSEIESVSRRELAEHAAAAGDLHGEVGERIDRLLAADEGGAAAHIRHVVDRMCRLTDWVALLSQAAWDLEQGEPADTVDALRLYRLTWLEPADPQATPDLSKLNHRLSTV